MAADDLQKLKIGVIITVVVQLIYFTTWVTRVATLAESSKECCGQVAEEQKRRGGSVYYIEQLRRDIVDIKEELKQIERSRNERR